MSLFEPAVPSADPGFFEGLPTGFLVACGVVGGLVLAVFVLAGVTMVRSHRHLKQNGIDPFAAGAHVVTRLSRSQTMAPSVSLEQRLTELDQLHRDGKISSDELAAARSGLLGSR
jgi:hypothetical protein